MKEVDLSIHFKNQFRHFNVKQLFQKWIAALTFYAYFDYLICFMLKKEMES